MISPYFVDQFKSDAEKYGHLKDRIKKYIESRYETCRRDPISVYSVCYGFQMLFGEIPQSALCHWLQEWGYGIESSKGLESYNHNVFIRLKDYIPVNENADDSKVDSRVVSRKR